MRANSLFIELLGGLRLSCEGRPTVQIPSRQAGSVLAFLALHLHRNYGREELIDLFWPDDDIEEGRNKLRKALTAIRDWLGQAGADPETALLAHRTEVRLNPSMVMTDVMAMEEALAAAARAQDPSERAGSLSAAVGCYRGELLPGFYDECFSAIRHRVSIAYETALQDLVAAHEQIGDLDRALETALRAVALNPASEDAHCAAMRLFAARGQPDSIVRQYRELERALEAELGEKPCDNTRLLKESLLRSGCETRTSREVPSPLIRRMAPDSSAALGMTGVQTIIPNGGPVIPNADAVIPNEREESGVRSGSAGVTPARLPSHRTAVKRLFAAGIFTVSLACALVLLKPHGRSDGPADLRTLPIAEVPAVVWRESYGPNEEKVGEIVLARWPEIEREAARLRPRPAAIAHFAAPLWRVAYTLEKGGEVGGWLKEALDSGATMRAADESLAASAVSFSLSLDPPVGDFEYTNATALPYGRRAHEAAVRSGDRWLVGHSLRALGSAETSGGEATYDIYRTHYAEAYRIFQELADQRGMALVETSLAAGYNNGRSHEQAFWAFKAYWRWQAIGNQWGIGFAAHLLQEVLAVTKAPTPDEGAALVIFEASKDREAALGNLKGAGRFIASESLLLLRLGRTDEAISRLRSALNHAFFPRTTNTLADAVGKFSRSRRNAGARQRLIEALRAAILQ